MQSGTNNLLIILRKSLQTWNNILMKKAQDSIKDMVVGVGVEATTQWQEDRIEIGTGGSGGSSRVARLKKKLFCITEMGDED